MNAFSSLARGVRRLAAAPTLLALLAAPAFANEAEAPRRGGSVAFNVGSEPPALVSATNTGSAMYIGAKVVEGLLAYDLDFNPKPQLATEWSVSEDGKTYRFKLREGVRWHDGEAFDAEDVKFSLLALKEEHPRGRGTFANLERVEILGPHEVELTFSGPAPYVLKALAALETPILPEHVFAGRKLIENPALNAPIGTGPFVFKEWIRGSHVLYERNEKYWDEGKPYLDQLVVRFISDPAAAVAALETGEVQVSFANIPLSDIDRLKANPQLGFETRGGGYINGVLRALFNLDRPELQDVRVRQAVAHAIDKQFILDAVYLGHARILHGPISPDVKAFFVEDLKRYAPDPALAEKLLDEAGYPRGADGTRFSLTIDPMQASGPHRQIADYFAQALNKIGIKAAVRTQDFPTFVKRLYTDRAFDLAIEPMSNLFDPTVGVQRLYWGENVIKGVPFSNGANYRNAEVDAWLEQASAENDPERRFQLFESFQRQVVEDLPAIDLAAPNSYVFFDKSVRGLVTTIEGVSSNWAEVNLAP